MSEELSVKKYCSCCELCKDEDLMNTSDTIVICPECNEQCTCVGCIEDAAFMTEALREMGGV